MKYLYDNGVSVPKVFPSKTGKLVENLTESYHASMFSKAPGRTPLEQDWNKNLGVNWGRIVGQMHLLTQSYIPLNKLKDEIGNRSLGWI